MLTEESIVLFFDHMNNRNGKKMADMISDETIFYFPKAKPIQGKDKIIRFFKILWYQYPELVITIQRIVIQGNTAVTHWSNKGRSRKNEHYENEGVTIMEINNDKITYISDFFKNTEKF